MGSFFYDRHVKMKYFQLYSSFFFILWTISLQAQQSSLCFSVSRGSQKIITSAHFASFNFKIRERKYLSMHQLAVLDSSLSIYAPDSIFGFIRLSFPAGGGHYFGMGEQYSHLDLKGTKPYVFTEEQGIGRGESAGKWSDQIAKGIGQ
jgi:hypothetical protein